MTDTFSANLNLDLPLIGASANTWGGAWNGNGTTLDALLARLKCGLELTAAGGTGTASIASGARAGMTLASAYTKTTNTWAVGSGNGGLDTGTIANSTWYHFYLIQRTDTGVVDPIFSLAAPATGPALPTGYTRFTYINSNKTDASAHWVGKLQIGNVNQWLVPSADYAGVLSGTASAITLTPNVPTGIRSLAWFDWTVSASGSNNGTNLVTSLAQTDTAPSTSAFTQIINISGIASSELYRATDLAASIRARFVNTDATYYLNTIGWVSLPEAGY